MFTVKKIQVTACAAGSVDFKQIEVGSTITTTDEKIAVFFDPGATSVS